MSEFVFIQVVVPQALPGLLTYKAPLAFANKLLPGARVVVPLGRSKLLTGIVHSQIAPPQDFPIEKVRLLADIPDDDPLVHSNQLELWEWMADYYLCTPGEVMQAALPPGLKSQSRQMVHRIPGALPNPEELSDKEYILWEALTIAESLSMSQAALILQQNSAAATVKMLMDKGLAVVELQMEERFKPKMAGFLELPPELKEETALRAALETLSRAPKQLEVMMVFLQLTEAFSKKFIPVRKSYLQEKVGQAGTAIAELIKKGVLSEKQVEIGRLQAQEGVEAQPAVLNEEQQKALATLQQAAEKKQPALLYGITGSGKTEVYFECIQNTLNQDKDVLFLVPEIALTTQLIERIALRFSGLVGVYHSHMSEAERVEVYRSMQPGYMGPNPYPRIVVGTRSSLFLPHQNLGLIVVDEEHDPGYKQTDPAPRYHGRDTALWLARHRGIPIVLGSATPSLESWVNAQTGKYAMATLLTRHGDVKLPLMEVVDMGKIQWEKGDDRSISAPLIQELHRCLAERQQAILFQNRRGFSLLMKCLDCSHVPQCEHCDISLTFHKNSGELRCHYCGYAVAKPYKCPACKSTRWIEMGFGTEKIEERVAELLPGAKLDRLDLDTTRRKNAFKEILQRFAEGQTDILAGTQMVTKGLDFDRMHLVAVIHADGLLYFPDFRAQERAFQLLEQVSGRAGRRQRQGKVLIQTYSTGHPVIRALLNHDTLGFYQRELEERKTYAYPPFTRLVYMNFRHANEQRLHQVCQQVAQHVKGYPGWTVLGPEAAGPKKLRNRYHLRIILKIPKNLARPALWDYLRREAEWIKSIPSAPELHFDVDPIG